MTDKTLTAREFKQLKKLVDFARRERAAYERTRKMIVAMLPPYIGASGAVDTAVNYETGARDLVRWLKLKVKRK